MKNLTFALACASTFALFAAIDVPKADFEGYEAGAKVSDAVDPNSLYTYWLYDGASGSEDGSTVTAYGGENLAAPTTGDAAGDKYLALSTEGGTLWRSLAAGKKAETDIANKLGPAQNVPDGGLYIDTMVQFTPAEDGGDPEMAKDDDGNYIDKLAIWLDVNAETGATNLCVLARSYDYNSEGALATDPTRYTLVAADGSEMAIQPGVWYQLTVKATKIVDNESLGMIPGFQIFVDGKAMKATTAPVGETLLQMIQSMLSEENFALLAGNKLFPSLATMGEGGATATLQAVGFKGSGALDNLSISETEPQPAEKPTPVTPQITLSATEATFSDSLELPTVTVENYVLGTDYTVSWDKDLPTENPSENVVLTVTVKMCGKYSGSNTATFTVKPASTPPVATDWPSDPTTVKNKTANEAYGITGDLAGVPADKLAIWAKGNGKVEFSAAGDIKVEAYLLNCVNTDAAITEAKANFKIPSITIDANGTVTVTSPDPDGSKYNGVITIKGSVTVNGTYNLVKGTDGKFPENARFFKAYLSVQ